MKTTKFTRDLDVRNVSALPAGTGCRFLECLKSHEPGVLVAAKWRRRKPVTLPKGRVLVEFERP